VKHDISPFDEKLILDHLATVDRVSVWELLNGLAKSGGRVHKHETRPYRRQLALTLGSLVKRGIVMRDRKANEVWRNPDWPPKRQGVVEPPPLKPGPSGPVFSF